MSIKLPDPIVKHDEWVDIREGVQRDLDAIALAIPSFGGKSVEIRFGTGVATWPGGTAISGTTTISHGLGRVPVNVQLTPDDTGIFRFSQLAVTGLALTTFTMQAKTDDGSNAAAASTVTFSWFAIG